MKNVKDSLYDRVQFDTYGSLEPSIAQVLWQYYFSVTGDASEATKMQEKYVIAFVKQSQGE